MGVSRILSLALLCMLALSGAVPLRAQDPSLSQDESSEEDASQEVAEARRHELIGTQLPDVQLTSVHGDPMDFAAQRGKWLLLAFVDRDSREEAVDWFERFSEDLARTPGLVVFNLLFPGKVSFVVPRAIAIKKIRKEVDKIMERTRQALPEDLREPFDGLLLRWHVDWRRGLIRDFGAPSHRLSMLLADPTGKIVEFAEETSEESLRRFLERVRQAPRISESPRIPEVSAEEAP